MRVYENSKRARTSGADNPQLVQMGQRICNLKSGDRGRFVMDGVTSRPQQNLWRTRLRNYVREFGVEISVQWFEHIMVVERL